MAGFLRLFERAEHLYSHAHRLNPRARGRSLYGRMPVSSCDSVALRYAPVEVDSLPGRLWLKAIPNSIASAHAVTASCTSRFSSCD